MKVVTFNNFQESETLWQIKEKTGEIKNIFQSYDWNCTWWDTFKENKRLLLMKCNELGQDVILPLYLTKNRSKRFPFITWDELRLIGTGESVGTDFPDFLGNNDLNNATSLCMLEEYLKEVKQGWDVINLMDLRPNSRALEMVLGWSARSNNPMYISASYACPYVVLDGSFQDYRDKVLSTKFRSKINYYVNRINKDFSVEFLTTYNCENKGKLFNDFIQLHQMRWEKKIGKGKFSDHNYGEFHRKMFELRKMDSSLYIGNLYLDGVAVASQYGYIHNGVYYFYQSGLRPGYDKYSLGTINFYMIINNLYSHNIKCIEMLRGEESYKFHFSNRLFHTIQILIYNKKSVKGESLYISNILKSNLKRYLVK